ncbi:hypothetical protein TNCV_589111 [Trichonephila clavipes]|nr:hypothetical protein TNCV_589111 [Trichonephila clavipes]
MSAYDFRIQNNCRLQPGSNPQSSTYEEGTLPLTLRSRRRRYNRQISSDAKPGVKESDNLFEKKNKHSGKPKLELLKKSFANKSNSVQLLLSLVT